MADIRCLQGNAIAPYLDALATLRIRVFRDFPYLYDGDHDYEADYLRRYAECPDSLFVLAFAEESLIGAATGMPLRDECDEFRAPFEAHHYDIGRIFYYGESVLLPEFRGQGIGKAFMAERERHARQAGYDLVAFCAVQRDEDHPARPAGYQPLNGFWKSRGYVRHPELKTRFAWKDLGEASESEKPMTFWLKSLNEELA
ncbi:GNAT family N-acetyltransferase [Modicisalibacter luteus]|uniref:GNAT family N-acetyltransferase n=1 Tax=Modicisalibacter luteus TaxID=453962 RepID=A0ABV7M7B6_9GAMM|nr:GNAT family N-acetyltransferase [Halomonas lutea]GHA89157.1 GNAT family acetyltransferase [Halomonas lutea]